MPRCRTFWKQLNCLEVKEEETLGFVLLKRDYNGLKVGQVIFNKQEQNRSLMKLLPDKDTSSVSVARVKCSEWNKSSSGGRGLGSDTFRQTYNR